MQTETLITNATIVNENKLFKGAVKISGKYITGIYENEITAGVDVNCKIIDANGKLLIPGVIDDQVHFREPGLTHKANISTESKAAVAGGITSFMDMPNVIPQTTTQKLLEERYKIAAKESYANYSFYMGATNDNLHEILKTNPQNVCGLKVFMGASTGNMLVDKTETLKAIFLQSPLLIAVHAEDETTIQQNIRTFKEKYGNNVPIDAHPLIRCEEACYKASSRAVELAAKYNTRLHILHLSTAKELSLFENKKPLKDKRITAEVCVHHLWFDASDYKKSGSLIKWNPAIKTATDRKALLDGLLNNSIDVVATDHAPHLLSEKNNTYFSCPSGAPLVQHSLVAMLQMCRQNKLSIKNVVHKMCHAPAIAFNIERRGFIREGYFADLVLVDTNTQWKVDTGNILYRCGWSPLEGQQFNSKVTHTWINGKLVYNKGKFDGNRHGMRLTFNR